METTNIDVLKETLLKEKEKLSVTAEKVRAQLFVLDSGIARIDAAVVALAGTDAKGPTRRRLTKGGNGGGKPAMPAAGKAEVVRYMESLLQNGQVLEERNLKEQVEELAQQEGYTRLGIGLRIKEAMNDERFAKTEQGVRMSLWKSAMQSEQGKVVREVIHT